MFITFGPKTLTPEMKETIVKVMKEKGHSDVSWNAIR